MTSQQALSYVKHVHKVCFTFASDHADSKQPISIYPCLLPETLKNDANKQEKINAALKYYSLAKRTSLYRTLFNNIINTH